MIKYHYYGLKGNYGYSTIACSEFISDNLLINIKSVAERFSLNSGFSKQQIHMINDAGNKIIGSILEFPPQQGERRNSYFCQQYILDENENEKYLLMLPKVISGLSFVTERSEKYNTTSQELPLYEAIKSVDIDEYNLKQLVQAVIEVTLDTKVNRQVFIAADSWNEDFDANSRSLIAKITEYLPLESRRRLGFATYSNNIEGLTMLFKIVCCKSDDVVKFKDLYKDKNCYYYNIDTRKLVPEIEIGSYVNCVFEKSNKIQQFISYCDSKLSVDNRANIDAYNAFSDICEIDLDDNIDNYIKRRKSILRNVFSFNKDNIYSKEYINRIFKNELCWAKKNNTNYSDEAFKIWLKLYENNLLDQYAILEYLFINREKNNLIINDFIKRNNLKKEYYKFCIKEQYYPQDLVDEIISKIMESGVLFFDIRAIIEEWGEDILQSMKIVDAIKLFLLDQIRNFSNDEISLQKINSKVQDLKSCNLDGIASQVDKDANRYLEQIRNNRIQEEKLRAKDQEKYKIKCFLEDCFKRNNIQSIINMEFIQKAECLDLSKDDLDKIAEPYIKNYSSIGALLFLICRFDSIGSIHCDVDKINSFYPMDRKNIIESQHQVLLKIANLPGIDEYDNISDSIIFYIKQNKKLYSYVMNNKDKLSQMINAEIYKSTDKLYPNIDSSENPFLLKELPINKENKENRANKENSKSKVNSRSEDNNKSKKNKIEKIKTIIIILLTIILLAQTIWIVKKCL